MKTNLLIYLAVFFLTAMRNSTCNRNKQDYFVDLGDNKTYKTIKIGDQIWMAENLAFYVDSGCWAYNNEQDSVFKYGYLYNWETAQNICPDGWRLPSKEDFEELKRYLKDNDFDVYNSLVQGGSTGFNANLEGGRIDEADFFNLKFHRSQFWSYTEHYTNYGWSFYLSKLDKTGMLMYEPKSYGFAIRCIKDKYR